MATGFRGRSRLLMLISGTMGFQILMKCGQGLAEKEGFCHVSSTLPLGQISPRRSIHHDLRM